MLKRSDLDRPWALPELEVTQLDPIYDEAPKCRWGPCESDATCEIGWDPYCPEHAALKLADDIHHAMDWRGDVGRARNSSSATQAVAR